MHLQPVRVNAMFFSLVSVSVAVYVFLLHIGSDDEGLNVNLAIRMCHQFVFMYRISRGFVTVRVEYVVGGESPNKKWRHKAAFSGCLPFTCLFLPFTCLFSIHMRKPVG